MAPRMIAGASALAMLAVLLAASSGAEGRDFHVGGRGGWAPNPAEPFNAWAERNRFQVNDTLVFRYNKDADAVLVVSPSHYDACNATDPILRLGGGDSRFVFTSSGPYFFISADAGRCRAGERLIVVVLAVRNNDNGGGNTPSPSLAPPKSPSSSPQTPPPKSPTSSPPPAATPAPPRALAPPPSPPKPSSSSPPPAATPTQHVLPPPPAPENNASSPSLAPVPAPAPASSNGTSSPPSPSSAVALMRGGVLAWLIIGGATILV